MTETEFLRRIRLWPVCTASILLDQWDRLTPDPSVNAKIAKIDGEHLCLGILFAEPYDRGIGKIGPVFAHKGGDRRHIGDSFEPQILRFDEFAKTVDPGTVFEQTMRGFGDYRFTCNYGQGQSGKDPCAPGMVLVGLRKPGDQRARIDNNVNRSLQARRGWPERF